MEQAIKNFWSQFSYQPKVINPEKLRRDFESIIVCGMGGSHLSADILRSSDKNIFIHSDYGLPRFPESILKESLIILDSYSGNTEEVIDALENALTRNFSVAVISTGGKLLKIAQERSLPFIEIPNTGIQPRAALGYQLLALAEITEDQDLKNKLLELEHINDKEHRGTGQKMAVEILGKTPVIYSSAHNSGLAYYWKITLNETGKIPAFYNVIPEMDHNEIAGFDIGKNFQGDNDYHFIFIFDDQDHPQIKRRMEITRDLLQEKQLSSSVYNLKGDSKIERSLSACNAAQWCALKIAEVTKADPENVPIIEDLKEQLKN